MTNFRADLINVTWGCFCHDPNPNAALEHFLKTVQKLVDKHAPYKNIKHPKTQFETKPWITYTWIGQSIKIKNKLYKSFWKEKDSQKKSYERQFKIYYNLISTLHRETKESYYKQHFRDNKKTETSMADHKEDNKHEKQIR